MTRSWMKSRDSRRQRRARETTNKLLDEVTKKLNLTSCKKKEQFFAFGATLGDYRPDRPWHDTEVVCDGVILSASYGSIKVVSVDENENSLIRKVHRSLEKNHFFERDGS